jgi:hypothetical protein
MTSVMCADPAGGCPLCVVARAVMTQRDATSALFANASQKLTRRSAASLLAERLGEQQRLRL